MPISEKDILESGYPMSFREAGECHVLVGPCSVTSWFEKKIPLDGRHYICSGTVFLKNGKELFANFQIQTHHFDFLERDATKVRVGDLWYWMDEPELYEAIGVSREDALPYTWLPDPPLDYHKKGPYPMQWPEISDDPQP
jgi:hypothetical protein